MKLDKDVVSRRVGLMEEEGIDFRTGVTVGADIAADELQAEFDAVVLATGATVARDLAIPGRELGGIHLAMSYLRGNTRRLLDGGADAEAPIDAAGKDVARDRRRRHRHGLRRDGDPAGRAERAAARAARQAAARAGGEQPVAGVAEGLQAGLRAGGGAGAVGRGPAPLLHDDPPVHRPQRARDRRRDRRPVVADRARRQGRDARGAGHGPGPRRGPRAAGARVPRARSRRCRRRSTASSTRAATCAPTPTR